MKTITRTLMLAILMLAVTNAFAQKKGDGENPMKKKIQAYNNQMVESILKGQDEKTLSFYSRNVISMPNYGKMLRGIDEVSNHQRQAKEMGSKVSAMKLTTKKVTEYGDALVEIGIFTITLEIKSMPEPISDEGKYLTIWEKQEDGKYRITHEIWNSDINPMTRMRGGQRADPGLNQNTEQHQKLEKKE